MHVTWTTRRESATRERTRAVDLAAVATVAITAFAVRAWPYLARADVWLHPTSYDDGVYFASSALFVQGSLPYRDFVFVHPPGILLLLSPLSALQDVLTPATAFVVARWMATLVGTINALLVFRLAGQSAGRVAAVTAGLSYALYPEAVEQERSASMEPWINLFCLTAASYWLRSGPITAKGERMMGLLLGAAAAVKLWAVAWVLPVLASAKWASGHHVMRVLAWATVSGTAIVLPFFIAVPDEFIRQVLLMQMLRPPDGIEGELIRLREMARWHTGTSVMAAFALAAITFRFVRYGTVPSRDERFWVACAAAIGFMFLVSRSFWDYYSAHLAPAECILAGIGAAAIVGSARSRWTLAAALAIATASLLPSIRTVRHRVSAMDTSIVAVGDYLRSLDPRPSCVLGLEPFVLVGNFVPTRRAEIETVVDSYGLLLRAALDDAHSQFSEPPTITEAMHRADPQARLRAALEGCELIVLGWRGDWQLTDETRAWILERFEKVYPPPGQEGLDVWRLQSP